MTPQERQKMNQLCILIQTEQNPEEFDRLVRELNDLIAQKSQRIHPSDQKPKTAA